MQFWLFPAALALLLGVCATEAQAETGGKGRILVAYFSWSGNARTLAKQIAQATGGDLFEIRTVAVYPFDYTATTEEAKREQRENARPALVGKVADMGQYSTVFLGYPNWWGTMPQGVFTFLESYDFAGKTLYPFVTHGGSAFGRSLSDIKKLCPAATLGQGLEVYAFDRDPKNGPVLTPKNAAVAEWLKGLGF
jgi:flavodoxin